MLDAGRVSALALVHVDGGMVPHLAMDVLDLLAAVARQRFVPNLLVSPIVHVLTTSESRYSLEVSSKILRIVIGRVHEAEVLAPGVVHTVLVGYERKPRGAARPDVLG